MNNITKYLSGAIIIMLLIIIAFIYKGCNSSSYTQPKSPVTVNPVIIKSVIIKDSVNVEEIVTKWKDSVDYLNSIISSQQTNIIFIDKEKSLLQYKLDTSLSPDKKDVSTYINESNKRDTICDGIVASQKIKLSIEDTIIIQRQNLYDSLNKAFNFLANQSEAQKAYEDSLQPKNEFYYGGGLFGSKTFPLKGIDAGIFLKTKTDRIYKVDIMYDFNTGIQYELSTFFKINL